MAGGLKPSSGGVPAATLAIVAGILLVAALLVPGQLAAVPADASGLYALLAPWPLPDWLGETAALPLRPFVHASPAHALLAAVGTAVAGWMHERRFGPARSLLVFLLGSAVALGAQALIDDAPPLGASGGALALFGALLMDLARRRTSASLFGPLVAPILLHGAIDGLVPGEYALAHGAGLVVGALLVLLFPSGEPPLERSEG